MFLLALQQTGDRVGSSILHLYYRWFPQVSKNTKIFNIIFFEKLILKTKICSSWALASIPKYGEKSGQSYTVAKTTYSIHIIFFIKLAHFRQVACFKIETRALICKLFKEFHELIPYLVGCCDNQFDVQARQAT